LIKNFIIILYKKRKNYYICKIDLIFNITMRKYRNTKKVKKYNYLSLKKKLRRFKRKRNIDKDGDIIMKENYKYDKDGDIIMM